MTIAKRVLILSCLLAYSVFATDAYFPVGNANCRLGGRPGELMQRAMHRRVFSKDARTTIYDEAENAFATHWDSSHCGWQNEYWGKTMLSVAGAIEATGDKALAAWALDKTHAFLKKYQRADGYLSTYEDSSHLRTKPESKDPNEHWCHNIWGQKYTLWGLLELHRVTGDKTCLDAAERMADHIIANLRKLNKRLVDTGSWCGISSLSILKPILQLYRLRPKMEYLALAEQAVRATDVDGKDRPVQNVIHDAMTDAKIKDWYDNPYILAKSYEIMSYFEGVADYHRLVGDVRSFAATKAFYNHLVREELNAMRCVGYFDHFLNARSRVNGMVELCDIVHWIRLNRELYLLTGKAEHLDRIEEAFYNAFLPGVAPDGSWGAHIVRSHGTRHLSAPEQTGMKYHQCCPDNMLRTFYDFAGLVAAELPHGGVAVNFYCDAVVRLPSARLSIEGGYPVSDSFRIRVTTEKAMKLRLRVPMWSPTFRLDDNSVTGADGWHDLELPDGETVLTVAFDFAPRIVDSSVWEDDISRDAFYTVKRMTWLTPEMESLVRQEPAATIMRGPILLAKGRAAGTTRAETFFFNSINARGFRAELRPAILRADNALCWGSWTLDLVRGNQRHMVPVADFWSVSCANDPENWFSLWF